MSNEERLKIIASIYGVGGRRKRPTTAPLRSRLYDHVQRARVLTPEPPPAK